ncbi:MAG: hypothetical protein CMF51_00345 [Legionellales bacterium]|nr:hypothetical protein [Legionellales bacterium]|tara:strand:- start:181 stop:675 length:495 start_codon:yes stop_codon:yes gene_type:complete
MIAASHGAHKGGNVQPCVDTVRQFSQLEANASLPKIRERAGIIMQLNILLKGYLDRLKQEDIELGIDPIKQLNSATDQNLILVLSEICVIQPVIQRLIDEIVAQHVTPEDLDRGIFTWPAAFKEKPIVWCWQWGEASVQYWRYTQDSFDLRQEIVKLPKMALLD